MLVIRYIIDHHSELFEIALAAHATAALIVNLTPTPKDDEVVGQFYRALEILAGIVTPMAKR
jgi:hypothetical protein